VLCASVYSENLLSCSGTLSAISTSALGSYVSSLIQQLDEGQDYENKGTVSHPVGLPL